MQTLDIISVNIWQIVISLVNLLLLFLILKKLLYAPVRKALSARESELSAQYDRAAKAEADAEASKAAWNARLAEADATAEARIRAAAEAAAKRSRTVLEDSRVRASEIIHEAENEALLTRRKAEEGIREELVGLSAALSEKLLAREINEEDHRALINAFIEEVGEQK